MLADVAAAGIVEPGADEPFAMTVVGVEFAAQLGEGVACGGTQGIAVAGWRGFGLTINTLYAILTLKLCHYGI